MDFLMAAMLLCAANEKTTRCDRSDRTSIYDAHCVKWVEDNADERDCQKRIIKCFMDHPGSKMSCFLEERK